jgi:hypothetical protein
MISDSIILAESDNYKITHSYEAVYLNFSNRKIYIGDFYGDPRGAIIDKNGKWLITFGEGLILYYLREPFLQYPQIDRNHQIQWWQWGRNNNQTIWIESMRQTDDSQIITNVEKDFEQYQYFDLNVENLTIVERQN